MASSPPDPMVQALSPRGMALSVWRHIRLNLLLCAAIAGFLTLLFRDNFWDQLVISLCIGFTIQALIEAGRYGLARHLIRRGMRSPELTSGWPGWRWMWPWVLASAVVGYMLGMKLGGWLLGVDIDVWRLASPRSMAIALSITLAASVVFTVHFYNVGQLESARAEAAAAERLASEHQLKLLQSQLEPHMLFNTLANLRVLIGLDPARAQAMLDRLIAYLRATLSASRAAEHPLQAEFDRLADYLALMAVRMGPRLAVAFDLPEALRQVPVPPLVLQPLVENSIQHGLEPKLEGGRIQVSARREADRLRLTVRDTGVGLPDTPAAVASGHGFGTAQVRERLAAVYGERARFTLEPAADTEGGTLATLDLPWPDTPCKT